MNISEDENELDSYGVWVKHSSGDESLPEVNNEQAENEPVDESLDLPDFDDSDFSDMFKDDSAETAVDDFSNDLDSTLSPEELANITNVDNISIEETQVVAEEPAAEPDTQGESDISLDDFDFDMDATDSSAEESAEETSVDAPVFEEETPSFEVETPSFDSETSADGDEEISLDDFMDGGFSDESVASGNNGFEEGKGPSAASSEEVSLDEFVDMSSFGEISESDDTQKQDDVVEETPLDMDISFDSSADTVQTEDNSSVENDYTDDEDNSMQEESSETEEISIDDFNTTIDTATSTSSENIETEEIDLSDFGIDSNAEETPIVQDVEESKTKDVVVDYDLSVGDENTTAAPVVNEIKDNVEQAEEIDEIEETQTVAPGSEVVSSSLLQQIVNDLSGLKDEINQLKSNLAEIKAQEHVAITTPAPETSFEVEEPVVEEEKVIEETPVEETPSDDNLDLNFEEDTSSNSGGFFDMDDTDDTIALSGDELDNIFNSAEFSEVKAEDSFAGSNPFEEETPSTESDDELPNEIEETSFIEEEKIEEEETSTDDISLDLPNEIPSEETVEEPDFSESAAIEESIFEDEEPLNQKVDEDLGDISKDDDLNFDFEDEKLEEPTFGDEIALDEENNEDLPDEISIPKDDNILVETDKSDFMDSVRDTTNDDIVQESENNDITFDTTDTVFDDNEPVAEETAVNEEEVEAEPYVGEPVTDSFAEVDNLDNNLTDSNIDYLTTKEDEQNETAPELNTDLKKDIKSVLLYMDQLLENLPEEKIVEFAKSEEFTTYKKLFTELGLS